jgi:translation initiation factor 5A
MTAALMAPRRAMDADEDFEDFAQTSAGASLTYPFPAGDLHVGRYVCINGHACRIVDIDKAQPGKHGHAKVTYTAVDLFTGKMRQDNSPASHTVDAPVVTVRPYMVLDVDCDGRLSLLDDATNEPRQDLNLPADNEQLCERVRALFNSGRTVHVSVLKAMDVEKVLSFKEECGK